MTLTAAGAGRRYVLLTALRWLPVGVVVPVTVLLASSRGLGVAEVGVVFAVHSLVALVLELPSGGLADAVGRRGVLAASGALHLAALLVLATARDLGGFAAAFALLGASRALDSGPLEAWYVDALHELAPGADATPGLSRAAVANGAGLAVGAVLGGLLPVLVGPAARADALVVPYLAAAALDVVSVACVLALVTPLAHERARRARVSARAALRAGVAAVPRTVGEAITLTARDRVLRRLLAITVLVAVGLSAMEVLGPLRFATLAGSPERGTAAFGVVMAVSFTAAAVGAAVAGVARRAARGSTAGVSAAACGLCALAVGASAAAPTVVLAGAAFAAFYLLNAVAWPLRQHLLHTRVDAAHRSTTVSAASLALMLGVVTGSLLLPRLADAVGLVAALLAAALPLLAAAVLSLRLRGGDPPQPAPVPGAQRVIAPPLRRRDRPARGAGAAAPPPSAGRSRTATSSR